MDRFFSKKETLWDYLKRIPKFYKYPRCFPYIFVQEPRSWEYERDVAGLENGGSPIDGAAADVEIARRNIADDGELDPVHGIGAGVQHKYCQHQPAPSIHPALSR